MGYKDNRNDGIFVVQCVLISHSPEYKQQVLKKKPEKMNNQKIVFFQIVLLFMSSS